MALGGHCPTPGGHGRDTAGTGGGHGGDTAALPPSLPSPVLGSGYGGWERENSLPDWGVFVDPVLGVAGGSSATLPGSFPSLLLLPLHYPFSYLHLFLLPPHSPFSSPLSCPISPPSSFPCFLCLPGAIHISSLLSPGIPNQALSDFWVKRGEAETQPQAGVRAQECPWGWRGRPGPAHGSFTPRSVSHSAELWLTELPGNFRY